MTTQGKRSRDERLTKPWLWPARWQRVSVAAGVVLGGVLSAPLWLDAWHQWQLAREGAALLESQQIQLEQLQQQNQKLRQNLTELEVKGSAIAVAHPGQAIEQAQQKARALGLRISELQKPNAAAWQVKDQWVDYPLNLTLQGDWLAWHQWLNEVMWQEPNWRLQTLDVLMRQRSAVKVQLQFLIPIHPSHMLPHASESGYDNVRDWLRQKGDQASSVAGFDALIAHELNRPSQGLEQFDRSELRLMGRVSQQGQAQAWFAPKKGATPHAVAVYRAALGDYVGRDFGQIQEIGPEGVRVSELVLDPLRGWVRQEVWIEMERVQ